MLLNCGVGEDSLESLGLQGDPTRRSILKEIYHEYSLEGLMLKLKLQYLGYLMWRANSLEKTLMLGKIEGKMRRGQQRLRWLDGITNLMDMSLSSSGRWWRTGKPVVLHFMELQRFKHDWATQQQQRIFQCGTPVVMDTDVVNRRARHKHLGQAIHNKQ